MMQFQFDFRDFRQVFDHLRGYGEPGGSRTHAKRPGRKTVVSLIIFAMIFLGIYYYVTLPAINYQETGFWAVLITVLAVLTLGFGARILQNGSKTKGLFKVFLFC